MIHILYKKAVRACIKLSLEAFSPSYLIKVDMLQFLHIDVFVIPYSYVIKSNMDSDFYTDRGNSIYLDVHMRTANKASHPAIAFTISQNN